MEAKRLEVPIKDFDTSGYDDFEIVPKNEAVKEEKPSEKENEIDLVLADGGDLLRYFIKRFKEVHGYDYKVDINKEKNIFENFKARYGPDAGQMIRILFDKHQGKLEQINGIVTATAFTKNSKWIQDMLYCELQEEKKSETVENSTEGLMTSNEFRQAFRLAI
jgi:hypothetical protein